MRAGRESGPHGSSETQGVTPVTAPFQHVASGDESSVDSSLLTAHRPELVMCLCPPHGWVTRRPDGPFGDRPVSRPQWCSTSSWMPRPRAFSARTHTKCLLTLRLDTSCSRPDALVPHLTRLTQMPPPSEASPDCPKQPPTPSQHPISILCRALIMPRVCAGCHLPRDWAAAPSTREAAHWFTIQSPLSTTPGTWQMFNIYLLNQLPLSITVPILQVKKWRTQRSGLPKVTPPPNGSSC